MRNWREGVAAAGVALAGAEGEWSADKLARRVDVLAQVLRASFRPGAALGILADNGPDWIAADLAAQQAEMTLVPLPSFFTPAQWRHALATAGVEGLFCRSAEHAGMLGFGRPVAGATGLALYAGPAPAMVVPPGVQKVTFTSGTTAQPKGVCLSAGQQWELAAVLADALAGLQVRRHLNLLPLSVLLENIAGVYTALLSGAVNVCLPLAQTGLSGAARFDPVTCLETIARERAESVILLPQMLLALVAAAAPHDARLRTLKFIAVGGAKTPPALIAAARAKGFPVYEGYGLSECGSVVALNLPGQDRPGSAGRPLPNRAVRIAADGEIEVGGGAMVGYLGAADVPAASGASVASAASAAPAGGWLGTGDLGHLDADGYLHIDGRKKNVLVTAFGRNVSPEWPEALLLGSGVVAQALVVGDARPFLVAAIVPLRADVPDAAIEAAVAAANRALPDYARVQAWFRSAPFGEADGTATANGRLRRDAAAARCAASIERLYRTPTIGD
ncbi:AMP-binding protein [uncultured Massilia sp.]|uniref:AMP-binding protein n=1 Tax=uncultured Massilia sp. TaxID=169973 RepID=UPI0025EC97CE|nr:AMP-binding protein [uncultured Massilia sp.]